MEVTSNVLLVYSSRYGAAEQYARWLAGMRDVDMMQVREAKLTQLRPYDTIIWMGGVYNGELDGLSGLEKVYGKLRDTRVAVFAVGMAPEEAVTFSLPGTLDGAAFYYGRGRLDKGALGAQDRLMLTMQQMAAEKKPGSVPAWMNELFEADEPLDYMDPLYLEPVLDFMMGR